MTDLKTRVFKNELTIECTDHAQAIKIEKQIKLILKLDKQRKLF